MSNHFHMLVRCRWLLLHRFMEQFQSQVARALNRHWGRSGHFFEGRYKHSEVLDDPAALDKLVYTMCNPCESNLVRHPALWPGLSSWTYFAEGEPMVGKWVNKKERWRLLRKYDDMTFEEATARATEEYPLEMVPLPAFEGLDAHEWHQKMRQATRARAEQLAEERCTPCLGVKKILAQRFDARPGPAEKTPQPACLCADEKLREEYIEQMREITDSYKQAVGRLRKGRTSVGFPPGTIPPGHIRCVGAPPADESPPFRLAG